MQEQLDLIDYINSTKNNHNEDKLEKVSEDFNLKISFKFHNENNCDVFVQDEEEPVGNLCKEYNKLKFTIGKESYLLDYDKIDINNRQLLSDISSLIYSFKMLPVIIETIWGGE
jgi:hypothetical protein